jgi:hypothetical protein
MHKINIANLSNAHNSWLRSLDFYKTEIAILQNELNEISEKNTSPDVRKEVEHYQNQLSIQARNIQDLSNTIRNTVSNVAIEARQSGAGYIDGMLAKEHDRNEEQFEEEEKVINDLRHQFYRFATEWM